MKIQLFIAGSFTEAKAVWEGISESETDREEVTSKINSQRINNTNRQQPCLTSSDDDDDFNTLQMPVFRSKFKYIKLYIYKCKL